MGTTSWVCTKCGKVTREGSSPVDVARASERTQRGAAPGERTDREPAPARRSNLAGTMVGGFLAVGLWALFGVEGFVAQLGLAFVGFAVGAGFVALVRLARG